jgi:hypothetical protein
MSSGTLNEWCKPIVYAHDGRADTVNTCQPTRSMSLAIL